MHAHRRPLSLPLLNQRGSVLVSAGAAMALLIALLGAIDLGQMYFHKREYQKSADLAALAGSRQLADGCAAAVASGADNASANLAEFDGDTTTIQPGQWRSGTDPRFTSLLGAGNCDDDANAVRALVTGTVPTMFFGSVSISASGTALAMEPIAQLRIRSTLASVDDGLLNDVTGSLLGGSVSLSAVSWQGLVNTDISLLSFLDALAVELGVDAGNYDQLLGTDVALGDLLGVAADVLNQGAGTGDVGVAAGALDELAALNLPAFAPLLQLGDILNVQAGTPRSGLDTTLNVFDLVQGSVQLASSECAVCATVPVNLPGVAGVQVRTQIIEPPQLSAIGRPDLAAADPLGPDKIYVRTAQVRTLVSVDLPIAGAVQNGLQALLNNPLISGITSAANSLLTLNLTGLLTDITCLVLCGPVPSDIIDIQVLASPRIDVYIEAGEGEAYVNDYNCTGSKSLEVPTRTAAADIRVGKMGTSAADAASKVFAKPATTPVVDPVGLLDIGSYHVLKRCVAIFGCSYSWATNASNSSYTAYTSSSTRPAAAYRNSFSGGGIGVKAVVPVAGTSGTENFSDPPTGGLPDVGEEPAWETVSSTEIVDSLTDTLGGLEPEFYQPSNGNLLGTVLATVGATATTLVDTLSGIIDAALAPLLDPLVDFLLDSLGLNLNQVDVGANLSCEGGGGTLVE